MQLGFLGGAREVGRSSLLVDTGKEKFILDCGIEVQHGKRPVNLPRNPDGVFITHAHLDHSGFSPAFYSMGYKGKTFATAATFDMAHMLLEDSLKVQLKKRQDPGFSQQDINRMGKKEGILGFREPAEFGSSTVELFSAGHIPGAAAVLVESRKKSILYTGDISFTPTDFMFGADIDRRSPDVIVSESTYSYKDHPDRKKVKERLTSIINQTCSNGGVTLLPAFAVGRTQELLLMLKDINFPIYLDGMGIRATTHTLSYPETFLNQRKLSYAFEKCIKVKRGSARSEIVKEPCVIITTAGMLQGGPAGFYISRIMERKECTLVFTGYQVEGTPGRHLLETGVYENEGVSARPKFSMHFLDLSSHSGRSGLIDFYRRMNPQKIMLVHGDRTEEFAEELKGMGFDAHSPSVGENITV